MSAQMEPPEHYLWKLAYADALFRMGLDALSQRGMCVFLEMRRCRWPGVFADLMKVPPDQYALLDYRHQLGIAARERVACSALH